MIQYSIIVFVEPKEDRGGEAILSAACFQLGMVGAQITRSFAEQIAPTGLTHKQVGLLAIVDAGPATSQRDIATRLRVAPSLVVTLVDQLVDLGAVSKTRSRSDRRAHKIEITPEGRRLLASAVAAAEALDADIRSDLSPAGRAALSTLLTELNTHQDRNP